MCNDLQLVLGCKRSTHLHVEIETKTRSTHRDLRQVQLFQPSCNKMQRGIYLSCVNYVIRKVSLRQQHPLMMEPERSVLPLTKCIKSARCHSECIFFFFPHIQLQKGFNFRLLLRHFEADWGDKLFKLLCHSFALLLFVSLCCCCCAEAKESLSDYFSSLKCCLFSRSNTPEN